MTRLKIISRMARRESTLVARAQQSYSIIVQELKAAEALVARLGALIEQRASETSGSTSVAQLRERRILTDRLAAEGERLQQRLIKLREDGNAAGTLLAQVEHRKRTFDKAALQARKAEIADIEARREASVPTRIRR